MLHELIQGSAHSIPYRIVKPLIIRTKRGKKRAFEVIGILGYSRNDTHVCVVIPPERHYVYRPIERIVSE